MSGYKTDTNARTRGKEVEKKKAEELKKHGYSVDTARTKGGPRANQSRAPAPTRQVTSVVDGEAVKYSVIDDSIKKVDKEDPKPKTETKSSDNAGGYKVDTVSKDKLADKKSTSVQTAETKSASNKPAESKSADDEKKLSEWDVAFSKMSREDPSFESFENMVDLADNFFQAATTIAKMIIGEQHVPEQEKKITPLSGKGVAGGDKFIVHGLFFKYPVDVVVDKDPVTFLYGGPTRNDINAAKASNHDLKGMAFVLDADTEKKLSCPLLSLIDFQGFRLTVMTTLPLGGKSLIYGSQDAGKTVHADKEIHTHLLKLGKILNLRPHICGSTEVAMCGDIEVHNFHTGGYYALDLARVFPPTAPWEPSESDPNPNPHGGTFYRLFRPEFVARFHVPLSSDGFSGFQLNDPNRQDMNDDLYDATDLLRDEVVALGHEMSEKKEEFAKFIQVALDKLQQPSFSPFPYKDGLITELQGRGINIRYLGLLLLSISDKNEEMRNFVASLIVVRALKNLWRKKIRDSKQNGDRIYKTCQKATLSILNFITNSIKNNAKDDSWDLIGMIHAMFVHGVMENNHRLEALIQAKMKDLIFPFVIIRFAQLGGVVLNPGTVNFINKNQSVFFSRSDVIDYIPVIRCPSLMNYYSALYYLVQANKSKTIGEKASNLRLALEKFESSDYEYPELRHYYTKTHWELAKLDKSTKSSCSNSDVIAFFKAIWEQKGSVPNGKEYIDYVLSSMWPFLSQKYIDLPFSKQIIVTLNKRISKLLSQRQVDEISALLRDTRRKFEVISSSFSQFLTDNQLSLKFSLKDLVPEDVLQIIKDAQDWDIDYEYKQWFFSYFGSLKDLALLSKQHSLVPHDKATNQFLFHPHPLIYSLFESSFADFEFNRLLTSLGLTETKLASILETPNEKDVLPLEAAKSINDPVVVEIFLQNGAKDPGQVLQITNTDILFVALRKMKPMRLQLEEIHLHGTHFDKNSDVIRALSYYLTNNTHLKKLKLMLWPLEECTTELFTSLQTIKSLEHLDLSDTGINTVKPVADLAAALPSLKYVNMSSCYIDPGEDDVQATKYLLTHMDEFRIPVGILDQFTEEDWEEVLTSDSLKHFHLSDMNDTIVENIMKSLEKNTSIEHFSIEQYSESHFDSWLNNVKTLKTLMLDYSAVPSIGDNHTNVTRLSLQSVECSDFEALFASLIKLFSVNSVLEELNLKGLDFEKVTAEFFEALSKTPIKTLICIPGDTIPDAGDVLSKLISDSKTLTSIDLTEAQLSFDDLTKIFNSLPKTNSLQKLILNRNKITPNEGEEDTISEALGNAIANNQSITSLSLNQTGAKDTTIEKLGAALAKNGTLTELNLEVNEDIKLIYPIFNALVNNTSLKTLNLNQCSHVSDWTKIPELPVSQLSLAYLSIAYHGGLGDTGFSALASILEKNTSITKLDISNCRLTDSSIATILTALHKNKTLKYLYMRNNTSVELEGPLVQLIQHTPLAYLNVYGSSVKGREIVLNDNWYKSFLVQS